MERIELERILESHKKWLNDEGGEMADLSNADLRCVNLSDADLRRANLRCANLRCADLSDANLSNADLSDADLSDADLRRANLRCADLSDVNLDFSYLPLHCGGLRWKTDKRLMSQLAYHFCSMECEDEEVKESQNALLKLANQFHRVSECGEIKQKEINKEKTSPKAWQQSEV